MMAEQEEKRKAEAKAKKELAKSGGNEYMGVLTTNDNKLDDLDAHGVEDAIAALSMDAPGKDGKRVNLKAAYKEYEERELARVKEDQPGLKLSQYKEIVYKAWQKSPENPMNQAQLQ